MVFMINDPGKGIPPDNTIISLLSATSNFNINQICIFHVFVYLFRLAKITKEHKKTQV